MDSLLANYASSDEEQEQENQQQREPKQPEKSLNPQKFKVEDEGENDFLSKPSRKILDSLPPPKSSLFNSLPPPKSHLAQTPFDFKEPSMPKPQPQFKREELEEIPENRNPKSSSTSLFSSLPQPKSSSSSFSSSLFSSLPRPKSDISETPQILPNSTISSASIDSSSKRVVQFRPPSIMNPISTNAKDEEEDSDEDEKEIQRKKSKESVSTSSVKSFLSSIPAPKNSTTLGALPSASGTGRRSMLETDASASNLNNVGTMGSDAAVNSSIGYSDQSGDGSSLSYDRSNWNSGSESYDGYGAGYDDNVGAGEGVDYSNWKGQTGDYANYGAGYGQYESNWIDESGATAVAEASRLAESGLQVPGKRGRNDTPEQIVEVKQDELLKNRPREDQVKLTGIAFGPAYKPASTKGKPSKLHKRKHQIGSLLYDLRQKETELAERRAKGFLTKAQTHAKYGWIDWLVHLNRTTASLIPIEKFDSKSGVRMVLLMFAWVIVFLTSKY
ncbi:Mitotic checkpoint protein PRCC [Abeliophyllum distichum]|uniref:Mitotic checkpoint protein PRCC n=1 Tax=Abeliophyllum distichum TaxID=126358 RepID=A0ABD1NTV1_9LAMI